MVSDYTAGDIVAAAPLEDILAGADPVPGPALPLGRFAEQNGFLAKTVQDALTEAPYDVAPYRAPSVTWALENVRVKAPARAEVEVRWFGSNREYIGSNFVSAGQSATLERRGNFLSVTLSDGVSRR